MQISRAPEVNFQKQGTHKDRDLIAFSDVHCRNNFTVQEKENNFNL